MIDLHLHTTASDGRLTAVELVARAAAAGVTVMAATDHDTTAATADVTRAARARGMEAISGIEITAVEMERDVHVLGYFVDPDETRLSSFLAIQRGRRIERVEIIARRLAGLGLPVDMRADLEDARRNSGRSIGRPQVARAMIAAGHVRDTREAFESWLASDRPGFVPREGAAVADVVATIHAAGGLASLAHPGKSRVDPRIPEFVAAGLDAIEAFHPEHTPAERERYARLARDLGVLTTGGSDFHGDPAHGVEPGIVSLPQDEWQRLQTGRLRA